MGRKEIKAYRVTQLNMSFTCNYEELDNHEQNDCYYPKGGISAIGILKSGHSIVNFSDATQMQTAIDDGFLIIQKKIKAEYPEPTAVEGENPLACGSETVTDAFEHVLEITDFNVNATNDARIPQLNSSQFAGLIIYMCEEEEIRVKETGINFVARGPIIPKSNKEKQHYLISANFLVNVNEQGLVLHEAPDGIFV
jgi:hypothetical protein